MVLWWSGMLFGSSLQRWCSDILAHPRPGTVPKGEVLTFCWAVLPPRPWWNYQAMKSVSSASSSLSALLSPCFCLFVLCMYACVCVFTRGCQCLSFPAPRMVRRTRGCPPNPQSSYYHVFLLIHSQIRIPACFPFILYFSEFLSPPKWIIIGHFMILAVCPID